MYGKTRIHKIKNKNIRKVPEAAKIKYKEIKIDMDIYNKNLWRLL